jgi:hypothetical protein
LKATNLIGPLRLRITGFPLFLPIVGQGRL